MRVTSTRDTPIGCCRCVRSNPLRIHAPGCVAEFVCVCVRVCVPERACVCPHLCMCVC